MSFSLSQHLQTIVLADSDGLIPDGTQVKIEFHFQVLNNGDDNPLKIMGVPIFAFQLWADTSTSWEPPLDQSREFFQSQLWTDLPLATGDYLYTIRTTVPSRPSPVGPALFSWYAPGYSRDDLSTIYYTDWTNGDIESQWYTRVLVTDIRMARVVPPKLSIRGHSSGVTFS